MRPVLWYLVFVGLPLVGLLGILRIGEGLIPPRAVHGEYSTAFDSSGSVRCVSAVTGNATSRLTISQSGPRLEIALGPATFHGTLSGDSIRAAAVLRDSTPLHAANCITSDTLAMTAALVPAAGSVQLAGEFVFPGCSTCPPAPFQAARVGSTSRD